MAVPQDIRVSLGRRELKMSLRTGYVREGRIKSSRMACVAQEVFDELRKGNRGTMAGLEPQQIRSLVSEWLREALEDDERARAERKRPRTREELEEDDDIHERLLSDTREYLATDDYRHAVPSAEFILEDNGLEIDQKHESFKVLCRELLKASIAGLEIGLRRNSGGYDNSYTSLAPETTTQPTTVHVEPPTTEETNHGPLLSEVLEAFVKDKMELEDWTEHTRMDNEPMVRDFIEMVGDIPIAQLSAEQMRDARDRFRKIPKGRKGKLKYADKTLRKLSDMDIPEEERYSLTTLNNRAIKVGGYLHWARDRGYPVEDGLATILKYKKSKKERKRASDDRAVFSPEDLGRIFNPVSYLPAVDGRPSRFWVPLIGLCTGMRIEEICQLSLEDIREAKGVWCIDINGRDDKSFKTLAGERLVPMPPALKDLGFLDYVDGLRAKGEVRLFSALTKAKTTGKYSHALSKWANRYIHDLGIVEDERGGKKVFHSFRHTYINQCKQLGMEPRHIKQVVGHEQGKDITFDHYGKDYEPDVIYRELTCKLPPQVDLSPLKEAAQSFVTN